MRLICLNAWGGRLIDPLLDYMRTSDADVICLQEVTSAVDPSPDRLDFLGGSKPLPQHSDLFDALSSVLPRHHGQFFPAMQGELFDAAGQAYRSRFGLASFVGKELAVTGQVADFVHGEFGAEGWGTPPVPRNLHAFRIAHPGGEEPIIVAQFHGLRELSGKGDTPARSDQVERVIQVISRIRTRNEPLILCGDFNLLPDSQTFARLADLGLTDLVTSGGFTDTRTSYYEKTPRYADYLLVTPDVKVTRFEVVTSPEVSDHRPLLLEFE